MVHRRKGKPESCVCVKPSEVYRGCSSILGLYLKTLIEQEKAHKTPNENRKPQNDV